jgi:hypothetical protein
VYRYFIWRCRFLNSSEEKGCMGGVGGGVIQVRNVTLRTVKRGNIEQEINFKVILKILRDVL